MRWKGPALALLGAAAVAAIAIGFTLGAGSDKTVAGAVGSTTGPGSTSGTTTTGEGVSIPKPGHVRLGHRLLVATVDDAMKQADPKTAADLMKVSHDAGFDAVLVSSMWRPGQTALSAQDRLTLGNVVKAADDLHMRVCVFVWHGLSGSTPRTERARRNFAAYAAALAKRFPQIRDVVVGNEPNLNTFWMPQFGAGGKDVAAAGYLELLARTRAILRRAGTGPSDMMAAASLVATLDASYYVDPSLLWNAKNYSAPQVVYSMTGNQLIVAPPAKYIGTFVVQATVSDGLTTSKRSFAVAVV